VLADRAHYAANAVITAEKEAAAKAAAEATVAKEAALQATRSVQDRLEDAEGKLALSLSREMAMQSELEAADVERAALRSKVEESAVNVAAIIDDSAALQAEAERLGTALAASSQEAVGGVAFIWH
jgi:hypothetical protein